MSENHNHPPVPTLMLLGYLIGAYALFGELVLIALHIFAPGKVPPAAHGLMIGLVFVISVVAWRRREDFQQLRWTRGRVELTGIQIVAVCLFVVGLGGIVGVIMMLTFGR